MQMLRKLDLSNTSMTSDHAIALCEILPEIKTLAFFRVMDNPLIQSGHGKMGEGQLEEGAAVYTALVAAVKVSRSLVRVDVDEPAAGAGDVIHSLSRRLLAYCIRNLEAGATGDDWTINTAAVSRESTELKLAAETFPLGDDDGLMDDEGRTSYEYDEDGVWQDEDNYVVGGTGVVKALGVCLGNKPGLALQRLDTFASLAPGDEMGQERANEMSKALLTRARSIKARIQPALNKSYTGRIKEIHHRRLLFLDDTLHRVINRFEEEYPECREISTIVEPPRLLGSAEELDTPLDEAELDSPSTQNSTTTTNISRPTSRRNSEVSLYSKSLQHEEAQMHKLGQYMMFANSRVVEDEDDDAQKAHKEEIMCEVHGMDGEELKRRIMQVEGGVDEYISKIERRRGSGAAEVVVHNGR